MNIVVLSPKNRGIGVTSIAYMLAVELKHRGEFVQLIDMNTERTSFMNMYKSLSTSSDDDMNGITNLIQLIRTGTINAEDMENCGVDLGVTTICVTPSVMQSELQEIVTLTKNCAIEGRSLYTVIDLNIEDSSSNLFKHVVRNADVCLFVLSQDVEHVKNTADSKSLNDKSLREHGIHTAYIVNRFEECALQLKDIWKRMNVKDTKCWFKVRYNKHILQVKSKGLYVQFAKAMHESNDPDVAQVKTDIARVASYVLSRH